MEAFGPYLCVLYSLWNMGHIHTDDVMRMGGEEKKNPESSVSL